MLINLPNADVRTLLQLLTRNPYAEVAQLIAVIGGQLAQAERADALADMMRAEPIPSNLREVG